MATVAEIIAEVKSLYGYTNDDISLNDLDNEEIIAAVTNLGGGGGGGGGVVTATNLDIRDLTSTSDSVAVHGDVGVLDQLDLTNSNPATVAIVDASGNQITSFGGGTQYADGTTQATPTGNAILWLDTSNVLRAPSATKPLPVAVYKREISRYRNTALSSTKQEIKATAGDIYGWNFINPNTVDTYIKIYDAPAASVTVGTTTPILTMCIPAAVSSTVAGVFYQDVGAVPQEICTSGITIAAVTGLADNSTTAPTTPIHCSVRYI